MNNFQNKQKLCKCGRYYHDPKFKTCWECYATQPANTFKHYKKVEDNGDVYSSVKEYQEMTGQI